MKRNDKNSTHDESFFQFHMHQSFDDIIELDLTEKIFLDTVNKFKYIYELFNDSFRELGFENNKPLHIQDLNTLVKKFALSVKEFLENNNQRKYVLHVTNNFKLKEKIFDLLTGLINYDNRLNKDHIHGAILNYAIEVNSFLDWFENYKSQINIKIESHEMIEKLSNEISESKAILNKINSEKTEEIYSTASANFLEAARNYEIIFYLLLFASFLFTIISLSIHPYSDLNKINFIITKIITITLVITLGTLFLRKAAHLRKLHEQANQTSLELQALPLYLKNIASEHHSEIYKELATKYFGKELDQTQNDKVGDLMQDQLSAGTELIRASAEMLKAKNGAKDE